MMTVCSSVAADSAHEHRNGDRQEDETCAAERRHNDDPEQTSVGQVTEAD